MIRAATFSLLDDALGESEREIPEHFFRPDCDLTDPDTFRELPLLCFSYSRRGSGTSHEHRRPRPGMAPLGPSRHVRRVLGQGGARAATAGPVQVGRALPGEPPLRAAAGVDPGLSWDRSCSSKAWWASCTETASPPMEVVPSTDDQRKAYLRLRSVLDRASQLGPGRLGGRSTRSSTAAGPWRGTALLVGMTRTMDDVAMDDGVELSKLLAVQTGADQLSQ
jgi:hypothetical protein